MWAPLADCITSVGRCCQRLTSKEVIRACKTIRATKLNRRLELSQTNTSTDEENNSTELEDLHAGKRQLRMNHSESKLSWHHEFSLRMFQSSLCQSLKLTLRNYREFSDTPRLVETLARIQRWACLLPRTLEGIALSKTVRSSKGDPYCDFKLLVSVLCHESPYNENN